MKTTTRRFEVPALVVFDTLTDIDRLPEWNDAIVAVRERPRVLEQGAQWVVGFRAMGQSWDSRSTLVAHDRVTGRFAYRSQTDDGNPSWVDWDWTVVDDTDGGCRVSASFDLHPATFWRRALLARIRSRQLVRKELPNSLEALAEAARHSHAK